MRNKANVQPFVLLAMGFFTACEQQPTVSGNMVSTEIRYQWPTEHRPAPDSIQLSIHRPFDDFLLEVKTPASGLQDQEIAEGSYRITAHSAILPTQPLYYGQTYALIETGETGKQTVNIPLNCISQQLNLFFDITKADRSIVIDSILCTLSGLCPSMDVNTCTVPIGQTTSAKFVPKAVSVTDFASTYLLSTSILGLVCPTSPETAVGPGLLSFRIYTHNEVGNKIFSYRANLYQTLTDTPSLTYDGVLSAFKPSTDTLTLRLNSLPTITYETTESNHDTWLDSSGIEIEI